jgi:hypothetical protein
MLALSDAKALECHNPKAYPQSAGKITKTNKNDLFY